MTSERIQHHCYIYTEIDSSISQSVDLCLCSMHCALMGTVKKTALFPVFTHKACMPVNQKVLKMSILFSTLWYLDV